MNERGHFCVILSALVLPLMLASCSDARRVESEALVVIHESQLNRLRDIAKMVLENENLDVRRHSAAFEALLGSFKEGTALELIEKYLPADSISRIGEGDEFSYHLVKPDGSDCWLTIVKGKLYRNK